MCGCKAHGDNDEFCRCGCPEHNNRVKVDGNNMVHITDARYQVMKQAEETLQNPDLITISRVEYDAFRAAYQRAEGVIAPPKETQTVSFDVKLEPGAMEALGFTVRDEGAPGAGGGRAAEIKDRVREITHWWTSHAVNVIERTAPKAAQYGAADLDLMGQAMESQYAEAIKWMTPEERKTFGRYAACAFYALGKVARIQGALERGELPHSDSEFDLEVYAVMMTCIRQTGRWV